MTPQQLPQYEIFAIRYATLAERRRRDNFIAPDPHDGPMPMDYFVWLIRDAARHVLIDTGFNQAAARARGRQWLRCPIAALQMFELAPESVTDVIITHLHYDHAGNVDLLPTARIHLQEAELHYAVGRYMCFKPLRHSFAVGDITHMVENVYRDRVVFRHGDEPFAPGIELVHVGGHTLGLQSVRVHTARGWVVLASDASHYYENAFGDAPFPIVHNVGDMLAGYRKLMALADSPQHFVPGHDPQVLERYPRHGGDEIGIAALHLTPSR